MRRKSFEDEINFYIYDRIETALRGRSWNWLRKQAGISQSSLQTQKKSDAARAKGTAPRFNLETLLAVAEVLGRPVTYFLPERAANGTTGTDPVAEEALRHITEIVDWARGDAPMPDAVATSRELADGAARALDPVARRAERGRKKRAARQKGRRPSAPGEGDAPEDPSRPRSSADDGPP